MKLKTKKIDSISLRRHLNFFLDFLSMKNKAKYG